MKRVGVLISGRGSNLQALIDAQNRGDLGASIVVVISNRKDALGVTRARKESIPVEILSDKGFADRESYDLELLRLLQIHDVDLVVLAGFMRIISQCVLDEYSMRIINVHPSLLPAFKGVMAQWQAVEYGAKVSGCSTHFVTADVDAGPIILQKAVPVLETDTGETLAERILPEEHRLLVKSVQLFCSGRLRVEDRSVLIEEQ